MSTIDDFKNKGFSQITIPISKQEFEDTVFSYREFDKNTSEKEKEKTNYTYNKNSRVIFGYNSRSDIEGFDNKSYFQFNPDINQKNYIKDNKYYTKFINNINSVYTKVAKVIIQIIEELDSQNYINKNDFLNKENKPDLNLRILNYKPKSECTMLAKNHVDRGILTLTLYETEDGLYFVHKGKEIEIKYKENQGNLFIATRWNEFSNEKIDALEHLVKNKGYNKERSAIVVFVNPNLG
ncbi:MAG: hypothetical protein HRU03_04985 [Nanoarchaeales archaeon]|nr:hypothetical protein [Nanoarchaeales archaeon]